MPRCSKPSATGISPQDARAHITALWQRTDTGASFQAALEESGWTLARGDRRDFVVIDPKGGVHSLARRIEGAKAKDVRARMADIDIENTCRASPRARRSSMRGMASRSRSKRRRAAGRQRMERRARRPMPAGRPFALSAAWRGRPRAQLARRQVRRAECSKARARRSDGIASAFESLLGGASKPREGRQQDAARRRNRAAQGRDRRGRTPRAGAEIGAAAKISAATFRARCRTRLQRDADLITTRKAASERGGNRPTGARASPDMGRKPRPLAKADRGGASVIRRYVASVADQAATPKPSFKAAARSVTKRPRRRHGAAGRRGEAEEAGAAVSRPAHSPRIISGSAAIPCGICSAGWTKI